MLRLEDRRPFAVRMADKHLQDYAGRRPPTLLKNVRLWHPDVFKDFYAPRKIDPLFPGDELRFVSKARVLFPEIYDDHVDLMRPRASSFRHSTEVRGHTCATPRDPSESNLDAVVPDYSALEKRIMADVYAEYEKAITDAVIVVCVDLDKPGEFDAKRKEVAAAFANPLIDAVFIDLAGTPGRTYEFPGHGDLIRDIYAKKPISGEVDRKDPKAYLQHDPTKSHKRSKRRRRR